MILIEKICELFKSTNLSEEHYADEIGMSQSHFGNCLNGLRNFPHAALLKIEKKHNCKLTDIPVNLAVFIPRTPAELSNDQLEKIEQIVTTLRKLKLIQDEEVKNLYSKLMSSVVELEDGNGGRAFY